MPDTPAIQPDADAQNEALLASHVQPKSDRETMMEEIAARNAEQSGEAATDDDPDKETGHNAEPNEKTESAAATSNDAQIAAQLAEDDRPSAIDIATEGKRTVRLKIDGEERDITLENIYRSYQKAEAADKRLSEATRLLEEAKKVSATQQTAAPAPAPTPTPPPKETTESVQKLVQALFAGDEQTAVTTLTEFLEAGRTEAPAPAPTPSPEEFARQVTPAIKQQLDIDSALSAFATEFPDVVADPYLEKKAADIATVLIAEGKSFDEALKAGGQQTRDWIRGIAGVPKSDKPTTTDTMTERLTRKQTATADQVVGASAKLTPQPEKEQTREEYLAEMRQSRGQPPVG